MQGKTERILQLLREYTREREKGVALRTAWNPGENCYQWVSGWGVLQVRGRPGREAEIETARSGPGDCEMEDSGCS